MGLLSGMFQINLENYPHSFYQIRERKINATKFLDELKTSLLRYFDQLNQQKYFVRAGMHGCSKLLHACLFCCNYPLFVAKINLYQLVTPW
jgi:hypothetical protein